MGKASQLNIGLIGAGVVGGGVVNNLTRNADLIAERLGVRLNLKWVCDKDESRLKKLHLPAEIVTGDAQKVLGDPDVHVIVELVGGTGFARYGCGFPRKNVGIHRRHRPAFLCSSLLHQHVWLCVRCPKLDL